MICRRASTPNGNQSRIAAAGFGMARPIEMDMGKFRLMAKFVLLIEPHMPCIAMKFLMALMFAISAILRLALTLIICFWVISSQTWLTKCKRVEVFLLKANLMDGFG